MQFGGVSGRKLLFIDDESDVTAEYSRYFGERGNSVRIAASLAEAAGLLEKEAFDAVVLDLILPDGNGLDIFTAQTPPVIILSAMDEERTILDGFRAGAIDYVVKPCSPAVLEARIALRLTPQREAVFTGGGLRLNIADRTVFYNGRPVALTCSECNILFFLIRHPGVFFDASAIYTNVWEAPSLQTTTVRYHISNLRRKLKELTQKNIIVTEFGKGYAFLPQEDET